jgi:hypothetical protein
MKQRSFTALWSVLLCCAAALFVVGRGYACTVGESVNLALPLDATQLSNQDRLHIADAVIAARQWPNVEIQAVVIAGAYVGERHLEHLKAERAANAKAYLTQLGIRDENILIDRKTLTDQMVRKPNGTLNLHQVTVELSPLCNGGCERLCDDPRVAPTSRVVK